MLFPFVWSQTTNLDGETNLKIIKASERTWDYLTPDKACEFKGMVYRDHSSCYSVRNSLS